MNSQIRYTWLIWQVSFNTRFMFRQSNSKFVMSTSVDGNTNRHRNEQVPSSGSNAPVQRHRINENLNKNTKHYEMNIAGLVDSCEWMGHIPCRQRSQGTTFTRVGGHLQFHGRCVALLNNEFIADRSWEQTLNLIAVSDRSHCLGQIPRKRESTQ